MLNQQQTSQFPEANQRMRSRAGNIYAQIDTIIKDFKKCKEHMCTQNYESTASDLERASKVKKAEFEFQNKQTHFST